MRAFLTSAVAMVGVAIGSMIIFDQVVQRNADQAFSSSTSVRLPGRGNTDNLVGRGWSTAKAHGWGNEIPTSNSPISNAAPLASK